MRLYRKWEGPPKEFWKGHIYWFVKRKKDLDGISVPNAHVSVYDFKNLRIFDISNLNNIKSLHARLPTKYRALLEYITGYNIQNNDNWLCGYKSKPKNVIQWCHAPSAGPDAPRTKWEDLKLYKYLLTKDPIIKGKYNAIEYKNVPIHFKDRNTIINHDVAILF